MNSDQSTGAAIASQLLSGVQPRYATVAATLAAEILDGKRRVGDMLPAEGELCQTFGVSRSTIREALRRLRELGLVSGSRGVGTCVIANRARSNYTLAVRSVADVMGYSDRTRLDITSRRTIRTDAAVADQLGCEVGSAWCHVSGIRREQAGGTAIACVELFIAAEFEDAVDNKALMTTPAYRQIERQRNLPVVEVRQEITAVALTRAQADILDAKPRHPGLHIRRRFFTSGGKLLEATLNVHGASDRFAYALRLGDPSPA